MGTTKWRKVFKDGLKCMRLRSRLKRVVKGRHWVDDFSVYIEDLGASIKRHTRSDLNKLNRKRTRKHRKAIEMFYGHIINPKITHYDKRNS